MRDQLLSRNSQIVPWAIALHAQDAATGGKASNEGNERGAEYRLAGGLTRVGRQSRCVWIWMTAPGKIMESPCSLAKWHGGLSKLDLAGQFFSGLPASFSVSGFQALRRRVPALSAASVWEALYQALLST